MQAVSPPADFSYDYHDLLFEPQAVKYRCTSGGGFSYPRTRPGPTVAWGDITLDVLAASPDDAPLPTPDAPRRVCVGATEKAHWPEMRGHRTNAHFDP